MPPKPKRAAESLAVMTQIILPSDANPLNAAFGGRVLEWIDICGGIAAGRHCRHAVVTAGLDDLHFHAAIRVGWVVTLQARVLAAFRSSMEVGVMVERTSTTFAVTLFPWRVTPASFTSHTASG